MARGDGLTRQLELWMLLDQLMSDGSRILTMKLTVTHSPTSPTRSTRTILWWPLPSRR